MIVLACIGMILNPSILQQPTVTATVVGNTIKTSWTVPAGRPSNDWIALYPKGAVTGYVDWVYISGTRLQVDTMTGMKDFTVPGGEWDVRYIDGTSSEPYRVLATATVTVVGNNPDPGPAPPPPVQQTRRIIRVRIVRASGLVELREPQEHTNYLNPAQSALEMVVPELLDGDEAFVDEWTELVVLPTRSPDRIWRVKVNKVLP